MKYIDKIGLTLLVTLIVSSCNDFLDEKPKKGDGIELETFEQLEALLAARMEPIDYMGLQCRSTLYERLL